MLIGVVDTIYFYLICKACNTIKGQLISKANFHVLIEPKNERNYFLISALASKNGSNQKRKGTLLY